MLATRVRVRPCSSRCILFSSGRRTTSVLSSWATSISGWSCRLRVPRGPVTVMAGPSIVTLTPEGTGMGRRPIRDMAGLPDVRQDFTTELGLVGLRPGHDSLARADDDDAEAAQHARDLGLAGVDAEAGLADPLEPGHDRRLAVDVLQLEAELLLRARALLADVGDEALVTEDARDLALGPRRRHDHLEVTRPRGVADAGEHVRDGIGDVHRNLPARLRDARQLAQQCALAEADAAQREPAHVRDR